VSKVVIDEGVIVGNGRPLIIYAGTDIPKAASD